MMDHMLNLTYTSSVFIGLLRGQSRKGNRMKLIENLKAVETGNRRHIFEPLHSIKLTFDKDPIDHRSRFAREYAIIVTIGTNEWIAEDLIRASDGEVITHAVENMKHAIIEHVYGELRRDLFDLRMEMRNEMNYYNSPSLKKLEKIMEKISL